MDGVSGIVPLLIALGILHLCLVVFSLRDLIMYARTPLALKVIWALVIIYVVLTGPLVYLTYGRGKRSWGTRVRELQKRMLEEQAKNDRD